MGENLKEAFIAKLEEKYGSWDRVTSRFGDTTFGSISHDLSISASQFSKLISGTATEGMYKRSIENIERLILRESLRSELEMIRSEKQELEARLQKESERKGRRRFILYGLIIIALIAGALLSFLYMQGNKTAGDLLINKHPLSTYFDQEFNANFNSPYLDISEVQAFCPCSAYEGKWSLSRQYKLPLPGTRRPGLYYLAKTADVRMKCTRFDTAGGGRGNTLSGYEYLINEIWLDTKMTPLAPRYFDPKSMTFTPEFDALDFESDPDFKKVAIIHSFFIDRFEITKDHITRQGEPCGRFATDINEELADEYEIDIKYVLENVLGDLTTTQCTPTQNQFCDPNDLREGKSVIAFDCIYTIDDENLGMGGGYPYTKGYVLVQQNYSANLLCHCDN